MKGGGGVRVCSDAVLRKFLFKLRNCGFTKPSGLRYLGIFGQFQCGLRFSYVILCGVYTYFCALHFIYTLFKKGYTLNVGSVAAYLAFSVCRPRV